MKYLLNAVLILTILSQTVLADDKGTVRDNLKNRLEAVMAVLEIKNLDSPAKQDRVAEIIEPIFDFSLMSKLALGRKHWSDLTKENRARFISLFTKRLKEAYLGKIDHYTDEKVILDEPLQIKKKIHIPTFLISKDKKISILYKFYKSRNNWKIYDIEVQGVSLIRTYRSQFSESLQSGTMEDLLVKLEKMGSEK